MPPTKVGTQCVYFACHLKPYDALALITFGTTGLNYYFFMSDFSSLVASDSIGNNKVKVLKEI
jgi:hypothetical protein